MRVLSDGHAAHFKFPQLHLNTGCVVDGFDHSVHGSVGGLIVGDDAAVGVREPDRDARRLIVVRGDAQRLQRPGLRFMFRAHDQRFDVAVEELFLPVDQCCECVEQLIEFAIADVKAELLHALTKRMTAAMLAEHEIGARQPHILGRMIS